MRGKLKKLAPKDSKWNPKPKAKKKYRITNNAEYNRALERRGDLTVYISEEVIREWKAEEPKKRARGRQYLYSDLAIKTVFMMSKLFRFSLRQTRGFMRSLFKIMNINLPIPDISRIVRRISQIKIDPIFVPRNKPFSIIMDSSGLKCNNGKEWQVHKHGGKLVRRWRKAHLMIDNKGIIIGSELTNNHVSDVAQGEKFIESLEQKPSAIFGDGGYNLNRMNDIVIKKYPIDPPDIIIPPSKNATESESHCDLRNQIVKFIADFGRWRWKRDSGYNDRNLVENANSRLKKIFGDSLKSTSFKNQKAELSIIASILNKFHSIGMPTSVRVS